MLRSAVTLLLALAGWSSALAQACSDVPGGSYELVLEGFGSAFFADFTPNIAEGSAQLLGGVCVAGEQGWELRTGTLDISGLPAAPVLSAAAVTLSVAGWVVEAESLLTVNAQVTLTSVRFSRADISGRASVSTLSAAGELNLETVEVQGGGFRISGERARLQDENLLFEDALATTCLCSDDALYVIRAPTISYDLSGGVVELKDGRLEVGSVSIALNDRELSPETLADITFPVVIEYIGDNEVTGQPGTGLGFRLPSLEVSDELQLELGITGVDREFDLGGVLLLHYQNDTVRFDVGRALNGIQADFSLRQPLTSWLEATFDVRNRHWRAADFLHEGVVGLQANQSLTLSPGHTLSLGQGVFAAGSAQTLGQRTVVAPRLGTYANLEYRTSATAYGTFSVSSRLSATHYPGAAAPSGAEPSGAEPSGSPTQYGLTFRPAWSHTVGPGTLSASWTLVRTNRASPFGTTLDRLEPKNSVALAYQLAGAFAPDLTGRMGVRAAYDFADPSPDNSLSERLESLALTASLMWQQRGLSVEPFFMSELAPAFNPDLSASSFLEAGFDLAGERWRYGLSARLEPGKPQLLRKVEMRTSFPLDIDEVTLEPFLAFDILPSLIQNAPPRVSGHGLEVTWRSCCGTLMMAYRQQENNFSTSFAIRFTE